MEPAATVALGVLLKERGEIDAAKAAYQQAIDSTTKKWSPRRQSGWGSCSKSGGRSSAAKAAYQQAIDSHHQDAAPQAALTWGTCSKSGGRDGPRPPTSTRSTPTTKTRRPERR